MRVHLHVCIVSTAVPVCRSTALCFTVPSKSNHRNDNHDTFTANNMSITMLHFYTVQPARTQWKVYCVPFDHSACIKLCSKRRNIIVLWTIKLYLIAMTFKVEYYWNHLKSYRFYWLEDGVKVDESWNEFCPSIPMSPNRLRCIGLGDSAFIKFWKVKNEKETILFYLWFRFDWELWSTNCGFVPQQILIKDNFAEISWFVTK